jgi:hypothetical protein
MILLRVQVIFKTFLFVTFHLLSFLKFAIEIPHYHPLILINKHQTIQKSTPNEEK